MLTIFYKLFIVKNSGQNNFWRLCGCPNDLLFNMEGITRGHGSSDSPVCGCTVDLDKWS